LQKPYSEACERNKDPILVILRQAFAGAGSTLEIGSGTGQHAVYFGAALPHLTWQTSDLPDNHAGIRMWLEEAELPNVRPPLALNVCEERWPVHGADAVFTANTLHIMSWPQVEKMFSGMGRILNPGGVVCIYGPFNYGGTFTSDSNARFDAMLRSRDAESGIRDFEAVQKLGLQNGLTFEADHPMPANNRLLVFRKMKR
jgi:SAM-dependent methyltransferase